MSPSEPAERSDADLAIAAGRGDREAFAALYRRHGALVYRFAAMMSGSHAMAEDVTQEVFVLLMRQLNAYNPQRARLSTYLYSIARNVTRMRLRQDRRFVGLGVVGRAVPEPRTTSDVERELAAEETLARLRRTIAMLPSRYREIVILCDLHELSYEEAATIIGSPIGTVRSRLSRARQLLAARMDAAERTTSRTAPHRIERCLA